VNCRPDGLWLADEAFLMGPYEHYTSTIAEWTYF